MRLLLLLLLVDEKEGGGGCWLLLFAVVMNRHYVLLVACVDEPGHDDEAEGDGGSCRWLNARLQRGKEVIQLGCCAS